MLTIMESIDGYYPDVQKNWLKFAISSISINKTACYNYISLENNWNEHKFENAIQQAPVDCYTFQAYFQIGHTW